METNEPIRVAQIVGKWLGGGVESFLMNYYHHIDRTKFQFDFICDSDSTDIPYEEIKNMGGKVILVPPYQKVLSYQKELVKIFKENNYKIVHSHINTLSVFPLRAARKAGVPVRIAHSHSTIINNKIEWKRNILKNFLKKFSKVYATDYFACSEEAGISQFGKKTFLSGKLVIINNAIDTKNFHFNTALRTKIRNRYNIPDDAIVLGTVGRLVKTKNPLFTLNLFVKYYTNNDNSYLLFVGHGALQSEIETLIKGKPYEKKVIFTGQINNVSEIYNALDIFLFPSLYEGLGMALIEAQYNGLRCIASSNVPRKTEISESIKYINLKNIEDWDETILKYSSELDLNVRKDIEIKNNSFDIESEVSNLEKNYQKICKER